MFKKFFLLMLTTLVASLGGGGNVLMAVGAPDQTGVSSTDGTDSQGNELNGGTATATGGQQQAGDLYETDLEEAIAILDPMGTSGLTLIESDAQTRRIDSPEFEFYSIGPRTVSTTLKTAFQTSSNSADRATIVVEDKGFAGKDDTIRVVGVKGSDNNDLMLVVINKDITTGGLTVYAKNGTGTNNFLLPAIPEGTHLVRMAKSCSETKAQTSKAVAYPKSDIGCVQNFMLTIEQSHFDKLIKKRVSWDFDDIVDWNMRDYKVVKELTYFFSIGGLDRHDANELEDNYTMLGIWWQAGRDLTIGHVVTNDNGNVVYETGSVPKVEIDGKDMVAFCKAAFIGNGGSQTKYLIAGANVVEAFDNIKGKQYETKDIVTENNLTIQNFKTSFGTIKLVYDKLFDICGMANAAMMIDKAYVRKVEMLPLSKTAHDWMKTGQRNTFGVVLQEINAVYLQYADAHARVWLAGRVDMYDYDIAARYDEKTTTFSGKPPYAAGNGSGHKTLDA